MRLVFTIRTADRSPKRNYLGLTVRSLTNRAQDFPLEDLHIFPTDPDVAWLHRELDVPWLERDWSGLPVVRVHVPDHRCTPNENGIRQYRVDVFNPGAWIVMLEDDLEVCADFYGSVERWLADHDDPAIHVYRLFALPGTPLRRVGRAAALAPLREMRGSQAIALRLWDALTFAAWATDHPKNWRPKDAPFQDRPDRGFDKLIGYWALQQWPDQPNGLVSLPMLVNHIGRESVLHSHGLRNDAQFAGTRYGGAA